MRFSHRLADEAAGGPRLAVLGQEFVAPVLPVFAAIGRLQAEPIEDAPSTFGALLRAQALHDQRRLAQLAFRLPVDAGRQDFRFARRGDPQRATLCRCQAVAQIEGAAQPREVGLQCRDVAAELFRRRQAGQRFQRSAQLRRIRAGQHVLARLGQRVLGIAVIDQSEVRRQSRFQREPSQQGLAERMDGADAHAARQVEHLREQRPRFAQRPIVRFDVKRAQFTRQHRVIQYDPSAEGPLQAHCHFGGGRLGEGQALDALGLRTRQHQAEQPVGQQLRLAGAGRRTNESGDGRVGGGKLLAIGALPRILAAGHWSSPAAAHSATRASCA